MSKENIDIVGAYNLRDFEIFKIAVEDFRKKVAKHARVERSVLGSNSNFTELESYIEHLQRKIGASMSDETIVFEGTND